MLTVLDLIESKFNLPLFSIIPSLFKEKFSAGDWVNIRFPNHSHVLTSKYVINNANQENKIQICSKALRAYLRGKYCLNKLEGGMIASIGTLKEIPHIRDGLALDIDILGVIEAEYPVMKTTMYSFVLADNLVDLPWYIKHYFKEQDIPFTSGTLFSIKILDYDIILKIKSISYTDKTNKKYIQAENVFFKAGKRLRVTTNFFRPFRDFNFKSEFLAKFSSINFLFQEHANEALINDNENQSKNEGFLTKIDRIFTIIQVLIKNSTRKNIDFDSNSILKNLNSACLLFEKGEEALCDFFIQCLKGRLSSDSLSSTVKFYSFDISLISKLYTPVEFECFWRRLFKDIVNQERQNLINILVIENFSALDGVDLSGDSEGESNINISLTIGKLFELLAHKNIFILWKINSKERSLLIKNQAVPEEIKKSRDLIELKPKEPYLIKKLIEFQLLEAAIIDEATGETIIGDERGRFISKIAKNLTFKSFDELIRGVMNIKLCE